MTPEVPAFRAERLRNLLQDETPPIPVVVTACVASTNETLRDMATEGAPPGTVVIADRQTAGRGRMGRAWHSPPRQGLYVSVLFRPSRPPGELTRWTLAAAVAACEACRRFGANRSIIKWPNDILWEGKKLGGVLTEMRGSAGGAVDLVVGAGLNVAQDVADFPRELSSQATSLRMAAGGVAVEREALAASYLRELAGLARRLDRGGWDEVARRWERLAPDARGARVRVDSGNPLVPPFEGCTEGLEDDGALRVRRDGGGLETVRLAGSVTPVEVR